MRLVGLVETVWHVAVNPGVRLRSTAGFCRESSEACLGAAACIPRGRLSRGHHGVRHQSGRVETVEEPFCQSFILSHMKISVRTMPIYL